MGSFPRHLDNVSKKLGLKEGKTVCKGWSALTGVILLQANHQTKFTGTAENIATNCILFVVLQDCKTPTHMFP